MVELNTIPETLQYLLDDETKAFAFLATTMPDCRPHVTPVWFNVDGDYIVINSEKGRIKDRNMRARPQVALSIIDFDQPYKYIQVHGEVVEISTEDANRHNKLLAHKYLSGELELPVSKVRMKYKIRVDRVNVKLGMTYKLSGTNHD